MTAHLVNSHNRFTASWSSDADSGVVKRIRFAQERGKPGKVRP